jgi:hypothetical protein
MKKLLSILLICCFALLKVYSQTEVNSYKYVIVPLQYKFLKGENKYRLNTLTKQLFLKSGYEVFYDKQLYPEDLFKDRCLAMYADVNEVDSGFRITNLEIELRDCKGKLIIKSELGKSGNNVHETRFQSALRDAYKKFDNKLYYQESAKLSSAEEEVKDSPKNDNTVVKTAVALNVASNSNKVVEAKNETAKVAESAVEVLTVEKAVVEERSKESKIFYAQKTGNGYQLVDAEPKIVMVLLSTALEDVFIVKGRDAIVYKKNNNWMYSENGDSGQKLESLNIKF